MIWNAADMLRGPFKPHEYGLVILPMTVVKRFHDCLLPTHAAVQETYTKIKHLAVIEGQDSCTDSRAGRGFNDGSMPGSGTSGRSCQENTKRHGFQVPD